LNHKGVVKRLVVEAAAGNVGVLVDGLLSVVYPEAIEEKMEQEVCSSSRIIAS
jgi:hypothetical protein